MTRPCSLLIALAFALAPVPVMPAGAQLVSTLDVGAASVSYDSDQTISAVSLSPMAQYGRGSLTLLGMGTLSRFETGALASSGFATGSYLAPPYGPLRGEALLSVGGSAHEDNTRAARYLGQLRGHLIGGSTGIWLGAGGGRAWDGSDWRPLAMGEIGGWIRRGTLLVAATISPATAGDTSWTDVSGNARWTRGPLELGATLGLRAGAPADDDGVWAGATGTMWIGRLVALTAAAGNYRADYMQGIPGGRYLSVGVRLASRPPMFEPLRTNGPGPSELAAPLARPVAGRLTVSATREGTRVVRVEAPGARRVEVMGDFTEWRPVAMQAARGGTWALELPLAAGSHRFNVRVDGGDWGVPQGVMAITDDFDGVVGLLTIR